MNAPYRYLVVALALVIAEPRAARSQDEEIMLTTPATRERVIEAMNAAAAEMQTTGQVTETDRWRSGIITRYRPVYNSQARVSATLDVSNIIHARFRQPVPDTTQIMFKAQVSAQISIMPNQRSALAQEILLEFVQRTRRQLAARAGQ